MEKIEKIISQREEQGFKLVKNTHFYNKMGINRRRWEQIMNGKKDPTVGELRKISKFFCISINELLEEVV